MLSQFTVYCHSQAGIGSYRVFHPSLASGKHNNWITHGKACYFGGTTSTSLTGLMESILSEMA